MMALAVSVTGLLCICCWTVITNWHLNAAFSNHQTEKMLFLGSAPLDVCIRLLPQGLIPVLLTFLLLAIHSLGALPNEFSATASKSSSLEPLNVSSSWNLKYNLIICLPSSSKVLPETSGMSLNILQPFSICPFHIKSPFIFVTATLTT